MTAKEKLKELIKAKLNLTDKQFDIELMAKFSWRLELTLILAKNDQLYFISLGERYYKNISEIKLDAKLAMIKLSTETPPIETIDTKPEIINIV